MLRIGNLYLIILIILLAIISLFSDLAFNLISVSFSFRLMYELISFAEENDVELGVLRRRIIYLFILTILSSAAFEWSFTNNKLTILYVSFIAYISSIFLSSFIAAHYLKKVREFSDLPEWLLMISLIVFPIFLFRYRRRLENFDI